MLSVLLVYGATAGIVRKNAEEIVGPNGALVETGAGSTRHSVCGQSGGMFGGGNHKELYSDNYEKFSDHFTKKVKSIQSDMKELRDNSNPAKLHDYLQKVDDRMDGFLKCAELDVDKLPLTQMGGGPHMVNLIKYKIMDDPRTGYLATARRAAAEMFRAIFKVHGTGVAEGACHLDGNKVDAVLSKFNLVEAGADAVGEVGPRGVLIGAATEEEDTYEKALEFIFQPQGCMDMARVEALRGSGLTFAVKRHEPLVPPVALVLGAVEDAYHLHDDERLTLVQQQTNARTAMQEAQVASAAADLQKIAAALIEDDDESEVVDLAEEDGDDLAVLDDDEVGEERPRSPGPAGAMASAVEGQPLDAASDYPAEGGVQPLMSDD